MTTLIALVESVLIVLSTVVLVLRRLFGKGRKRKKGNEAEPPSMWRVVIAQPIEERYLGYVNDKYVGCGKVRVPNQMGVYVIRGKGWGEAHVVGTVDVIKDGFDAEIARLTVLAEERASSLNALDVYA